MKWLILLVVACTSLQGLAQSHNMTGDAAEQNLRALGSHGSTDQIRTFNDRYEGVRGTPFLNPLWYHAVVVTTKNDTLRTLIKLDTYSDDVWAILRRGDSIIVDKGLIRSFSFYEEKQSRHREFFFDQHLLGYFELLYSGQRLSLACKWRKELVKAVVSGGYPTGNPYDEFIPAKTQYFVIKDNKLHLLRPRRSTIRELLGEDAARTVDEQEITFKDEKQVIRLVQDADRKR
jgi:hypothetical protein